MKTDQFSTRQQTIDHMYSACERSKGYLKDLYALHLEIDRPERVAQDSEEEWVLRLRKVCFHVQAIVLGEIGPDSIHLMGPDIRAAREQLAPIVMKVYEDDGPAKLDGARTYLKTQTQLLPLYSHPTAMTLIQPRDRGGFHEIDALAWLGQLHFLLMGLAVDYALGLEAIARTLSPLKLPAVGRVAEGVRAEIFSPLTEAAFRFKDDTAP